MFSSFKNVYETSSFGSRSSNNQFESIEKKLEELSPECRRVLMLCFCCLVAVFNEIDVHKTSNKVESTRKENKKLNRRRSIYDKSMNEGLLSNDEEEELVYNPISGIPFGAARILWIEILGLRQVKNKRKSLKSEGPPRKIFSSSSSSDGLDFNKSSMSVGSKGSNSSFRKNNTIFQYWKNFVSAHELEAFLEEARSYKSKSTLKRRGSRWKNFFQSFESIEEAEKIGDTDSCINFIRDKLQELGFFKIKQTKSRENEEDNEDENIDDELDDNVSYYWDDQHSVISSSVISSISGCTGTSSIATTPSTYNVSMEGQNNFDLIAKKRRNLIRLVLRRKCIKFLQIRTLHHKYGKYLCRTPKEKGGFVYYTYNKTVKLFNRGMVDACFRHRARLDSNSFNYLTSSLSMLDYRDTIDAMIDDASLYALQLLPTHMLRADIISPAFSLLQSSIFANERLTLLNIKEGTRRHRLDCDHLRFVTLKQGKQDDIDKDEDFQQFDVKVIVTSCLENLLKTIKEQFPITNGAVAENRIGEVGKALNGIASWLISIGWEEETINFYKEALQYTRTSYGSYHIKVSNTLHLVGNIYMKAGKYSEAVTIYEEAVDIEKCVLSCNDTRVGDTLKKIAVLYGMMGKYDKAITYYEDTMLVQRENSGKDCPEIAGIYRTLGILHSTLDNYDDAIFCFQEALRILKSNDMKTNNDDQISDASQISDLHFNIGNLYIKKGKSDISLNNFRIALSLESNLAKILKIFDKMSKIYVTTEKYDDAILCCEECLRMKRKVLDNGKEDEDVAKILLGMAGALDGKGEYDKTIEILLSAYEIIKQIYGETNEEVSDILYNIGIINFKRGDLKDSLMYFNKALDIKRNTNREDKIDVADTLQAMADVYFKMRNKDDGIQCCEEALKIRRAINGRMNIDVATSCNNLGVRYLKKGDYDKAMPLLKEALYLRRSLLGNDSIIVADTIHNVGLIHKYKSEFGLALQQYIEALRINKLNRGENHPKVADTMYNIGIVQNSRGNLKSALKWQKEALRAYQKAGQGEKNKNVVNTLQWIKFLSQKILMEKKEKAQDQDVDKKDVKRTKVEFEEGMGGDDMKLESQNEEREVNGMKEVNNLEEQQGEEDVLQRN